VLNSKHLEFVAVKVSRIVGDQPEDSTHAAGANATSASMDLCLLYPTGQTHLKTLKPNSRNRHSRGIEEFMSQVELQMNCEQWNHEALVQLFIIKREDCEQDNNYIWQAIRDLAGDQVANHLISPNTENEQHNFKIISSKIKSNQKESFENK